MLRIYTTGTVLGNVREKTRVRSSGVLFLERLLSTAFWIGIPRGRANFHIILEPKSKNLTLRDQKKRPVWILSYTKKNMSRYLQIAVINHDPWGIIRSARGELHGNAKLSITCSLHQGLIKKRKGWMLPVYFPAPVYSLRVVAVILSRMARTMAPFCPSGCLPCPLLSISSMRLRALSRSSRTTFWV